MDGRRFDALTRHLSSRRTALGGLMAGVLLQSKAAAIVAFVTGLLTSITFDEETDAKLKRGKRHGQRGRHDARRGRNGRNATQAEGKKKRKKKKKKKAPQSPPPPPPPQSPPPPPCANGTTLCGASCVDIASDVNNCGSCGAICAAGQSCQGGTCTCNGQRCAGCCDGTTCQATNSDAQCGLGGVACVACAGGRTCQNGSCACPTGQDICNDACFDLQTDDVHCGACGNDCAQDETCQGGVCGVNCGPGGFCPASGAQPDCCASTCTNVTSDFANCNGCGNACNSQTANQCVAGACKCGSNDPCTGGQTCCNGTCRNLTNDVNNCNACGNVCPGTGQTTADVSCQNSTCTFTCRGQNYDVDNNPSNGCERADTQTNHTQATAQFLGSRTCDDSDTGAFSGTLFSDSRMHTNPTAPGFDFDFPFGSGSAPLWYRVFAEGGLFCQNDPFVTVSMPGAPNNCYRVSVKTNSRTTSVAVINGSAVVDMDSGSYPDDTDVFFTVEKTCPSTTRGVASFTATFNL